MVFDPFRARRPVDNTSPLSVTPGALARAGYQQVGLVTKAGEQYL